jgi:hypothetical protein
VPSAAQIEAYSQPMGPEPITTKSTSSIAGGVAMAGSCRSAYHARHLAMAEHDGRILVIEDDPALRQGSPAPSSALGGRLPARGSVV